MQLPEIFIRGGFLLELLNTMGLGILGVGLVVYYRALLTRSDTLRESLNDLKSAHETVLAVMDKRAREIDARFEDEKSFRTFIYRSLRKLMYLELRFVHGRKMRYPRCIISSKKCQNAWAYSKMNVGS
jgi:hypothetical protein